MKLLFPCSEGGISQIFKPNQHFGIDVGWSQGGTDDILAAADGVITFEGYYKDVIDGKTYKPIGCIIKHEQLDGDYYTLYTHLASTCVDIGQKVKCGDKIGKKGNTGKSTGKHLHFQLMRMPKGTPLSNWNANAIDPVPFMYRLPWQGYKDTGLVNIPLEDDDSEVIALLKKCIELLEAK